MKKTLLLLSILGSSLIGLATVSAQYYGNTTTNTSYGSSYSYGQNHGGGQNYSGGIGSYTIECTTYYYNTRTMAPLYTQNICTNNYQTNYQYPQETTYYYPAALYYDYDYQYYTQPTYQYQYSYPYDYRYVGGNYGSHYGSGSNYCTYQYVNGGWYGCGW